MVRETSGRPGIRPADRTPVPLPELGIALDPELAYRFRIGPVTPGASRSRLWTLHAHPLRRDGRVIFLRPLRRWGHPSDAPAPLQAIVAGRIMGAELLPQGGARSTRELTLSEGGADSNGAPSAETVAGARYVTPAPGSSGANRTAGALAVAPAVAPIVAAIPPGLTSAGLRIGRPIAATDPDALDAPELAAFLLVAHRSHCSTTPEGCDISRGYWSELVALYGKPRALGAFYRAERIMETRRAQRSARALLALAPMTQAVPA